MCRDRLKDRILSFWGLSDPPFPWKQARPKSCAADAIAAPPAKPSLSDFERPAGVLNVEATRAGMP